MSKARTLARADTLGATLDNKVELARSINTGTGLHGGGDLTADRTIALADTAVTPGDYGSASLVPVLTVDQQGRITSASTTSVAGVSSFTYNSTTDTLNIGTADGGSFDAAISIDFAQIGSKPTTIAGYGITDGVQEGDSVTLTGDVTGTATFDTDGNVSITTIVGNDTHTHAFSNITGKPTTIAGYGITDAYTSTQTDTAISTAVSNLVDSSPAALDTLNELAAALGDDPNFATTVSNSIGLKQDASTALTTSTTFGGDVSGTYNAIVIANDSHTHDGRYYTETESDSRFVNVAGDTMTGALTLEGTLQYPLNIYNNTNGGGAGITFSDVATTQLQKGFFYFDHQDSDSNSNGASFHFDTTEASLAIIAPSTGNYYVGTNKVFNDAYHPDADKWTTGRTITLTGDVTGTSAAWDGSGNVSFATVVGNNSHTHDDTTITGIEASTASTVVQRNSSGDINARLFRSEYDVAAVAASINHIMVQYNTAADNYIRPASPATIRTVLNVADGANNYSHPSDGGGSLAAQTGATVVSSITVNTAGHVTATGTRELTAADISAAASTHTHSNYLTSDADDTLTAAIIVSGTTRDEGIFGTYDSTKTQHIWSMGTAYRNNAAGTNFGNLYGAAYKHTNNTTGGTMAGGHQMVWCQNGTGTAAIGTGVWTSGNVTGTDFYVADQILHTGDTNTYLQFHAADQWRVVTGGAERFEVNNSATKVTGIFLSNVVRTTQAAITASTTSTTLNFNSANDFKVNMSSNTTFTFSNVTAGQQGVIYLIQDATGGRTFTLPSIAKTPFNGASIAQNTGASNISVLSYTVLDASNVLVNYIGDFA